MIVRDDGLAPAAGALPVLYLADIRCPLERANGIQTFETCHALASRGLQVTLLVRDDTARPRRDPFVFYGLPPIPTLHVQRLRMAGPQAARRAMYLAAAVLRATRWSRTGCVFTRDLGVAAAILRVPSALRPPLVYESHGFAPVFSRTMTELFAGASPGGAGKLARLTRRERRVWRRADGYVTTTGVLASELRRRFGDRPRVLTVPNGVRIPARDEGVRPLRPIAGPTLLAYAGHLYPWKGVDVLIHALERLPDARALIIGGLPGEPDLDRAKALATHAGVGDRIEFTGLVERSRVPALLARADILVLPTVATASAIYTSPLKLFEYFAAGRPVVAADLPPVREIVRDGENGLLFTAGDSESLAASVRRLQADPLLAARMALTSSAEAGQYGWDRRAERLDAFLRTVADRPGTAGTETIRCIC
jgi:glycosyltransferase involved in cell wall biosynthesis